KDWKHAAEIEQIASPVSGSQRANCAGGVHRDPHRTESRKPRLFADGEHAAAIGAERHALETVRVAEVRRSRLAGCDVPNPGSGYDVLALVDCRQAISIRSEPSMRDRLVELHGDADDLAGFQVADGEFALPVARRNRGPAIRDHSVLLGTECSSPNLYE